MKKYVSYLFYANIRKVSLWVVSVILIAMLYVYAIMLPLLENMALYEVWTDRESGPFFVSIMVLSLFSAMLAAYIFRTPIEDGSELVITAKPIPRNKLVGAKFIAYLIFLTIFSLLPAISLLVLFAIPQYNVQSVGWVIVSDLLGNLIVMLFYGSIAALLSLRLSKVLVVLTNVCIMLLLTIYNTVSSAVEATPKDKIQSDKKYSISGMTYINKDNKADTSSCFTPITKDLKEYYKVFTLDGQKQIWDDAVDRSSIRYLNDFNVYNQLKTIYFVGGVDDAWFNKHMHYGIAGSQNMTFNITDLVNKPAQDFVDPEQTPDNIKPLLVSDDDPYWTNIGNINIPNTYYRSNSFSRQDTYSIVNANKDPSLEFESIEEFMVYISSELLNVETSLTTATQSVGGGCSNSQYYYDVSKTTSTNTYVAYSFYDGIRISKNSENVVWQNCQCNEYEEDLFNWILYNIIFTDKYFDYGESSENKLFIDEIDPDNIYWCIDVNTDKTPDGKLINHLNRLLYTDFFQQDDVKQSLKLNSAKDVGKEIAKFKFWASQKLQGYNDTKDYRIKNFTINGVNPVVPWDAYFKCVFNPQYNSMNVANLSEFADKGKPIISHGFIPINNYGDENDTTNWLNYLLVKEEYRPEQGQPWSHVGVNRLTPVYNGSVYGSNNKPGSVDPAGQVKEEYFKAYDFATDPKQQNSWSNYPTIDGYGYYSRIGLMSDALISCLAEGNDYVYYNNAWSSDYSSQIFLSSMPYIEYTNMLFNYDGAEQIPAGFCVASYLLFIIIFLAVAYTRFVKLDIA